MSRFVVLDSGPTSLGCQDPSRQDARDFQAWLADLKAAGVVVCLPEVVDYEVRRKLLHLGSKRSIQRLDALGASLKYLEITTSAMRRAVDLWADARRRGRPTSGPRALDADSILAAQALLLAGPGDTLTIATDNVGHLGQFADARPWATIA